MQTDTKNKILDIAADLLQDKGFNAFSYHHISSLLGIKNAAVHYHYPTKESLGIDIIRRARSNFAQITQEASSLHLYPWQQFDIFLDIYRKNLSDNHKVCLMGSLGAAYFTLPSGMQEEVKLMVNEILDWLTQLLESGRSSNNFTFKGDARSKATLITTSLAGALQMARITDNTHFHTVIDQVKADLSN
ncbi:MAG: TetR/AcrR family transcriptional regulator [Bacteroidota bacterium]